MVIRPFWAVMTAVHTVRALKKYLRLRLRHPCNCRPTVCVRPIPITVRRSPLLVLVVGLSEFESIDNGVGIRDEWRREDTFPLKDPAILHMWLVPCSLSLDIMIVRRESHSSQASHDKLFLSSRIWNTAWRNWYLQLCNPDAMMKAPLTYTALFVVTSKEHSRTLIQYVADIISYSALTHSW